MTINGNGSGPAITLADLKQKQPAAVFEASLSPEQCRRILRSTQSHDANFRKLSDDVRTMTLIEAMKKDRWVWTDADPLRLHAHPETGEIVCTDGQHRLYAAATARRVLRTLVLWGDEWAAGVHVDRNRMRNVAQYLQHDHGMKSAPVYVAAARLHLARVLAYNEGLAMNYARNLLDDESMIEFILKSTNELTWAMGKGGTAGGKGFSTTGYHVFMYELLTISLETANSFHDDLKNNDLEPTNPLAQLRRVVGRRYNDTGIRMTATYSLSNLVKAHNLRSSGTTVSKWVNASTEQVTFPGGFRIDGKRVRVET